MVKTYKLDHLRKFSRREVELLRGLYEFLPATDARERLHLAVRKALIKHLGQDIRYFLSTVERMSVNEFAVSLPEVPVVCLLGLTPLKKKLAAEIDRHISNIIINKLLGGDDLPEEEARPLTETEQGVLQYLIMQILAKIYETMGDRPRVHFRYERFLFDPSEVEKYLSARENLCVLTIEVGVADQSGFVRLAFPYPFLEEMIGLEGGAGRTKDEREFFARRLGKMGYFKTSVWAEAGKSFISPLELKDLERGDVVLFDEAGVELSGKKIGGSALVHFGESERVVASDIEDSSEKSIRCKLRGIVR